MRIVLRPGPGAVIGEVDGQPLSYRGRTPLVDGRPVAHAEIASALVDAVDEAATRVFGPVWVKKLGLVAGLGLRRCQRDRIEQFGLPSAVLRALAIAAAHPDARALGDMMVAVARLYESCTKERDTVPQLARKLGVQAVRHVTSMRAADVMPRSNLRDTRLPA